MNKTNPIPAQPNAATDTNYENNPLYVSTNGLDLLFKKALSVGIFMALLTALSLLGGGVPSTFNSPSKGQLSSSATGGSSNAEASNFMDTIASISLEMWLFIGLILVVTLTVMMLVITVLQGVTDVTSAYLARGKKITVTDALKEVFSNFWGYLWVLIIMYVKIFLWTLLFIIPGIIMAIRYSLSGVVYFDKKLKGNASVLESSRLVKGGWLTTFASQALLNMLTLFYITPVLMPGTNAILYRQFSANTDMKPKAHIVSWLTVIIPLVLGLLALLLLIWAAVNFMNSMQ